jgi:hypothetical protein
LIDLNFFLNNYFLLTKIKVLESLTFAKETTLQYTTQVIMKTVTIEIKNDIALSLLHNLESMHILRVIENSPPPDNQKLSERFAGCLSKERTEELQKELSQMRNEWERNTY